MEQAGPLHMGTSTRQAASTRSHCAAVEAAGPILAPALALGLVALIGLGTKLAVFERAQAGTMETMLQGRRARRLGAVAQLLGPTGALVGTLVVVGLGIRMLLQQS